MPTSYLVVADTFGATTKSTDWTGNRFQTASNEFNIFHL
jgi:hypothetical protein